jgi:hypothetical protein
MEVSLSDEEPTTAKTAVPAPDNRRLRRPSPYDKVSDRQQPGSAAAEATKVRRGAGTNIMNNARDKTIRDFEALKNVVERSIKAIDREAALLPPPSREDLAAAARIRRNLARMFPELFKKPTTN